MMISIQASNSTQTCMCFRVQEVTGLVSRASEACFLVRILIENQLPRLTTLLDESWRKRLQSMSLKDLVCTKDGEETMTQIIAVLLDEHQKAAGQPHTLLTCPCRMTMSCCSNTSCSLLSAVLERYLESHLPPDVSVCTCVIVALPNGMHRHCFGLSITAVQMYRAALAPPHHHSTAVGARTAYGPVIIDTSKAG